MKLQLAILLVNRSRKGFVSLKVTELLLRLLEVDQLIRKLTISPSHRIYHSVNSSNFASGLKHNVAVDSTMDVDETPTKKSKSKRKRDSAKKEKKDKKRRKKE